MQVNLLPEAAVKLNTEGRRWESPSFFKRGEGGQREKKLRYYHERWNIKMQKQEADILESPLCVKTSFDS